MIVRRILTRILSGVLGIAFISFGIIMTFILDDRGHVVIGLSAVGTSVWFLDYAYTGREFHFRQRTPNAPESKDA